ncbi:NAD-dependent epimerase/dehydratase family protein [Labrys sp. 22185]|uniref:NAD-dependent epimerase/dehydratase family protein n=1 Tax=Labrys sp. 22185 TaxID=3453888 RepID=UPI003F87B3AC
MSQTTSPRTIFLAGATGAIGAPLTRLLRQAGHRVVGTTRTPAKADALRELGAEPVVVDVFDRDALVAAVTAARPEIVIHQLTDLPPALDPARMADFVPRNARIRREGTANLVAAALAAGARRIIAQSIAWVYAPGPLPHAETALLNHGAEGPGAVSVQGVIALEDAVLQAPAEGVVLRYGYLYGPGTGSDSPRRPMSVHVDAAALAALLAIDHGKPGAYNVAEASAELSTARALDELGWRADFRLPA